MTHAKKLTRYIFIALFFGVLIGIFLPQAAPYVSWLGTVFKLSLAMIVMPIVLTSIIGGMGSVGDVRKLGRLGIKTIIYYLSTTFIAIIIGLTLVSSIQPGVRPVSQELKESIEKASPASIEIAPDFLSNIVAKKKERLTGEQREDLEDTLNDMALKGATIEELKQATLRLVGSLAFRARLAKDQRPEQFKSMTVREFMMVQINKALINPFEALAEKHVFAVIIFTLLFGGALTTIGSAGRKFFELNHAVNLAVIKIVGLIMRFAPLGVFGLIVDVVSQTGPEVFRELGLYALCVVLGLSIHAFIILPTLQFIIAGQNPREFFSAIRPALAIAFSTSSSSATLPVTMKCVEEDLKVDKRISRFVLPLGATINMDGTALYEAVAAVFIAQLYGVTMGLESQILIAITAALAAIGAAGIPAAGTVTMALVLSAVGLPLEGIGLLLAIDRPLDMCRTAVNITGDATGVVILSKIAKDDVNHEKGMVPA